MKPVKPVAEFTVDDGRHVVIRALKRSDIDSLVTFANTLAREKKTNRDLGIISFDKRLTKKDEKKFLNMIINGVRKKEVVSLGAFVDGKLVGHCDVRRRKPRDIRHTGVLGIVILEGYRGVGVGERLMTEVLREALCSGVWLIELTVFSINEAAIHLYEKVGYRRVGVVPNKMLRDGRHLDEVAMYADLRGTDGSDKSWVRISKT